MLSRFYSPTRREHFVRRFVRKILLHPLYIRLVKALTRSALVHEKSAKFRFDVANAIMAAEFEATEFKNVRALNGHDEIIDLCLRTANPKLTTWIELGVMAGVTIGQFLAAAKRLGLHPEIHGFDSFEGMPEDWTPRVKKGDLSHPMPHFSEKNVTLHKGWFEDTLPKLELTEQIGFLHVDCDLYSSTMTAFNTFKDYLGPGTVILFDEYWNYPEYADHEIKALQEFIESSDLSFEYLGYNRDHMQAAVVLR